MDAIEFLKEKERMCEHVDCEVCGLSYKNNGTSLGCINQIFYEPEKAVAYVKDWVKGNPKRTMLTDFLEKHPNAPLKTEGISAGTPTACPRFLGYSDDPYECNKFESCIDCWNRGIE